MELKSKFMSRLFVKQRKLFTNGELIKLCNCSSWKNVFRENTCLASSLFSKNNCLKN